MPRSQNPPGLLQNTVKGVQGEEGAASYLASSLWVVMISVPFGDTWQPVSSRHRMGRRAGLQRTLIPAGPGRFLSIDGTCRTCPRLRNMPFWAAELWDGGESTSFPLPGQCGRTTELAGCGLSQTRSFCHLHTHSMWHLGVPSCLVLLPLPSSGTLPLNHRACNTPGPRLYPLMGKEATKALTTTYLSAMSGRTRVSTGLRQAGSAGTSSPTTWAYAGDAPISCKQLYTSPLQEMGQAVPQRQAALWVVKDVPRPRWVRRCTTDGGGSWIS
jgi:hypothetical protein